MQLWLFEEDALDRSLCALAIDPNALASKHRPQREDSTRRRNILARRESVFYEAVVSWTSCPGGVGLVLVFVYAVAEGKGAADCYSEDFAEAREAGVVAFAVFGGGRFVLDLWLVTSAGALCEGAFGCDGGSR